MSQVKSTAHMDESTRRRLQYAFKYLNRFMIFMWRLGIGWSLNLAPKTGGQIFVITHIGRKSGLKRRTPANYALVDGDIYCTVGFGQVADWYRNIKVHPEIEVWLPGSRWKAVATEVTDPLLRLPLLRQVLIGSGFAARVAGINPYTMTDDELANATDGYRLLRIQRTERLHESGDLVWVWPLALALGIIWLLLRNHSHVRRV